MLVLPGALACTLTYGAARIIRGRSRGFYRAHWQLHLMADFECVVVGAGVIGLAIARALALSGREVLILEAGPAIGGETSSRNSEVIHAGLYYPTGSLKHRLCREGRDALYRFCTERGVPHRRIGKLIVATDDEQMPALDALAATARQNGVRVEPADAAQIREMEPALRVVAGLVSPDTGIIDSHSLLQALQGEAEAHGAVTVLRGPVLAGTLGEKGFELQIGGAEPGKVSARCLINAAGLGAERLSRQIAGIPAESVPR